MLIFSGIRKETSTFSQPDYEDIVLTPTSTGQFNKIMEKQLTPLDWNDITPNGFIDGPKNPTTKVLELIKNLAKYMSENGTTRYADAMRIARETIVRFPKTFEKRTWKDEDVVVYSDGLDSLRSRIYERLK